MGERDEDCSLDDLRLGAGDITMNIESLIARCLHHGAEARQPGDAVGPAIVPASVYLLGVENHSAGAQYGRWTNPTWSALEEALSVLEDAETVIFPSGMAAIASIFYSQVKSGVRMLLPSDGYYTTRYLATGYLAPAGVTVEMCPTVEYVKKELSGFRLVWLETPSNPGMDVCDIRNLSAKAKECGALVVADNSTLTPIGQRPLDLGADAVISSDTKALNGHSDVLFGHVASRNSELIGKVRDWRKVAGIIPGPFEAWLVHRGLETLEVRFDRMCKNAEAIAARLSEHPRVQRVRFPGLPSDASHLTAKSQMMRFGTLVGVTFESRAFAEQFINECRFIRSATSFGTLHTSADRRARWGDKVPDGFIRLSLGCEPTEALWKDMSDVLDSL
jgi:cystathionine gamma-lyase